MFPASELGLLLEFVRGKVELNAEVFEAAISVLSYFGKMFLIKNVATYTPDQSSDDDVAGAIENILASAQDDSDFEGHRVASLSPILISIVLKFIISAILKKISV
jgi:hypothetical protein